jgi:hypothetical protein
MIFNFSGFSEEGIYRQAAQEIRIQNLLSRFLSGLYFYDSMVFFFQVRQ